MADERRRAPYNVTSAYQSRSEEIEGRQRRYLWAMGSRVVLFAITILFFRNRPWVLYPSMVVSMVLPYFAVVLANGGRKKPRVGDAYVAPPEPLPALETVGLAHARAPHVRTIDAD